MSLLKRSIVATLLVCGLALSLAGCGGSSGPDKMAGDKMGGDKMGGDKMGGDKMGGDKMAPTGK